MNYKNSQDELLKRVNNLFNNLQKNTYSVFYLAGNNVSKTLLGKVQKSVFEKDRVFLNLYKQLEDRKPFQKNNSLLLVTTPFYDLKKNVNHSTLFSISKPFELLHADIADTQFLAKSAVDPKYCLLLVDLFTSKVYVCPMKSRNLLAKKLKLFYEDVEGKRNAVAGANDSEQTMRLQTDLEFKQDQILKLNKEFNVEMFHTRLRGGKAFAAEQKIGQFKKLLLKGKRMEKQHGKRLKPLDLIRNVKNHMNNTNSTKYNLVPEVIEKKSLDQKNGVYFREIYDFMRIRKIKTNQARNSKYDEEKDRRKRQLRSPLALEEKVLVLAERLKKKDVPGALYKASTENIPFFNRERISTIYRRVKLENGIYFYWLMEEGGKKVSGRFLRQELFALNNQFVT